MPGTAVQDRGLFGPPAGNSQAITQSSTKATGVTVNGMNGVITLNNAALNTLVAVNFTLTNSVIAATDVVVVCHASGGTPGAYTCSVGAVAAGSCLITVFNNTGGSLSEAAVLNFVVIKAS